MTYLPALEIEPESHADAAVVWLHGLGADGHDFEPMVPELGLPEDAAIRFVFPHAPAIPVTVNGNYVMPAWYDILEMEIDRRVDVPQLMASADAVARLIDREIERGIDSRRIIIAGFSQGGAVGLQAALTYPKPLAGLMALSTYFATADQIEPDPANSGLPVLVCHGLIDSVVPETLGSHAHERLTTMGYISEYKTYDMGHNLSLEEIRDISTWLQARLGGSVE